MAILSLTAGFGAGGANGTVFLGGATALNLLGEVSTTGGVPDTWKSMLNKFLKCKDGDSFELGGQTIIRDGFYVKAKNMAFKETAHGSKGPAYWELAEHVAGIDKIELSSLMRKILASPTTACDPWVATLTAAMFLSEVARNPRSFMINLMLLDLIEGGVKYGRESNKELDFSKLLKFDSLATKKVKTYTYADRAETVGHGKEAGTMRGGKLPMSQKDAMEQFQQGAEKFKYEKTFDDCAKHSRLSLKPPAEPGVGYHFATPLLEKECTVMLRWLLAYLTKAPLTHMIGTEKKEVPIKPAWGSKVAVATVDAPIMVPVSVLARRDHVREAAWTDAATKDPRSVTLQTGVKQALKARQSGVSALL